MAAFFQPMRSLGAKPPVEGRGPVGAPGPRAPHRRAPNRIHVSTGSTWRSEAGNGAGGRPAVMKYMELIMRVSIR